MPTPRSGKPLASLSLDLDNLWSYLKIHGDPAWEALPSYLDVVVPRVLEFLAERGLRITFFVVGQDAAREENRAALAALAAAGHEIANHSFRHESWLHLYSEAELEEELARAEQAIEAGDRPTAGGLPGSGVQSFRRDSRSARPARLPLRREHSADVPGAAGAGLLLPHRRPHR